MSEPRITVTRFGVWVPMSREVMDDAVGYSWLVFRALPGMEQEAVAARKRMLELGWGEGKRGPRGWLP